MESHPECIYWYIGLGSVQSCQTMKTTKVNVLHTKWYNSNMFQGPRSKYWKLSGQKIMSYWERLFVIVAKMPSLPLIQIKPPSFLRILPLFYFHLFWMFWILYFSLCILYFAYCILYFVFFALYFVFCTRLMDTVDCVCCCMGDRQMAVLHTMQWKQFSLVGQQQCRWLLPRTRHKYKYE